MDKLVANFINLNFYLSLVPFRVNFLTSRNSYGELKHRYEVQEGPYVQHLIAGTLLVLDIFQGVLLARGAYWEKVVKYPSVLFLVWKTLLNSLILGLFWAWTFWRDGKREDFRKILKYLLNRRLNSEEGYHDSYDDDTDKTKQDWLHTAVMWTFLIAFGLIFPIGTELIRIFNVDGVNRPPAPGDNFRLSSAQVLFDFRIIHNHTHISPEEFTNTYFSISVVYIILRTWGKVLLGMAHILTFIIAFIFYSEVERLHRLAFSSKQNLKCLIQHYFRFSRLVHLLNNVNRPILLCLVSASVPLFVLRVIDAWDQPQLSVKFIILIKLVQFLTIVSISAEGNYKATLLKTQLLELCHQNVNGKAWAGHIYRDNFALDNGRFAKISYSFIGSMLSAYLSYAIMLLQISPCQSSSK